MKTGKLLDLTLREILENYCIVMSLECDYIYGICSNDDAEEIYNKYDIDDVSFVFESLIDERILVEIEDKTEFLSVNKMDKICNELGFEKKYE